MLPLLLPTLRLLHRVGVLFMFPLRLLDQICDGLRTFGQRDQIVEELERREFHASMKEDLQRRCPDEVLTKQDLENMRELSEELGPVHAAAQDLAQQRRGIVEQLPRVDLRRSHDSFDQAHGARR